MIRLPQSEHSKVRIWKLPVFLSPGLRNTGNYIWQHLTSPRSHRAHLVSKTGETDSIPLRDWQIPWHEDQLCVFYLIISKVFSFSLFSILWRKSHAINVFYNSVPENSLFTGRIRRIPVKNWLFNPLFFLSVLAAKNLRVKYNTHSNYFVPVSWFNYFLCFLVNMLWAQLFHLYF